MNNWNALGYAAYFKHHRQLDLDTGIDWEWLHIQGVQNAGLTVATNLMAGTSTGNAQMIPVEDKINEWTSCAKSKYPLYVRYAGQQVPGTNIGQQIRISIWAPKGLPGKLAERVEGDAIVWTFYPKSTSSFDKVHKALTSYKIRT